MNPETIIANAIKKGLPFVLYQFPESKTLNAIVQNQGNLNIINNNESFINQSGFIVAPSNVTNNHPAVLIEPDTCLKIENWDDKLFNAELDESNLLDFINENVSEQHLSNSSKKDYLQQANSMITALQNGEAEKAILSRIKLIDTPANFNPITYFNRLREHYPHVFCYLLFLPNIGIWIGATPELLLEIDDINVKTVSLAGTQKDEGQSIENVTWGSKEKEEQQIVTEEIAQVFNKHFNDKVTIKGPETVSTGNLLHLKSYISAALKDIKGQPDQLINDLHPSPAIVGRPRKKAQTLIESIENHDRSYYTGYLGNVNTQGNTRLFVNLRCMQVLNNKLALYVGGGLTKNSQAEAEWQETEAKAETLLSLM